MKVSTNFLQNQKVCIFLFIMDKTETKQELETIEKQFGIQTHRTSGAVSKHIHITTLSQSVSSDVRDDFRLYL